MSILEIDLPRIARTTSALSDSSPAEGLSHTPTRAERLQELEEEWSIEGIFEGSAAVVGLTTFVLGLMVDDLWLIVPLLLSVLLLQQTLQGWCPLLPLLRGLGFRCDREIQWERHSLLQKEEDEFQAQQAITVNPQPRPEAAAVPSHGAEAPFSLRDFLLTGAQ